MPSLRFPFQLLDTPLKLHTFKEANLQHANMRPWYFCRASVAGGKAQHMKASEWVNL